MSLETSAAEGEPGERDSLGLWEENPQGPASGQAEPPSQESSSGYVKETVAGIAQLKLGTPPHEMESPTAQVLRTRHLLAMPSIPSSDLPLNTERVEARYKPRSSIQRFQDQAVLANVGPPPLHPIHPPTYAPELGREMAPLPTAGPPYAYLRPLSLVPSFEPPQVYAVTETVTAEAMQQVGSSYATKPTTPSRLGVRDPTNPMFSDVLRTRREKDGGDQPPPSKAPLLTPKRPLWERTPRPSSSSRSRRRPSTATSIPASTASAQAPWASWTPWTARATWPLQPAGPHPSSCRSPPTHL